MYHIINRIYIFGFPFQGWYSWNIVTQFKITFVDCVGGSVIPIIMANPLSCNSDYCKMFCEYQFWVFIKHSVCIFLSFFDNCDNSSWSKFVNVWYQTMFTLSIYTVLHDDMDVCNMNTYIITLEQLCVFILEIIIIWVQYAWHGFATPSLGILQSKVPF